MNIIENTIQMAEEGNMSESTEKSKGIVSSITTLFVAISTGIMDKIQKSSLMIILKYDEKFFYVLSYFIASVLGTFYYQGLFLLYIIFFFM